MILSYFLSRQIEDDSNPHEIIPISFNIWKILQENYHHMITDTYNVQTRAQANAQANAPTILDTQPVMQKVTAEVKDKDKFIYIALNKSWFTPFLKHFTIDTSII